MRLNRTNSGNANSGQPSYRFLSTNQSFQSSVTEYLRSRGVTPNVVVIEDDNLRMYNGTANGLQMVPQAVQSTQTARTVRATIPVSGQHAELPQMRLHTPNSVFTNNGQSIRQQTLQAPGNNQSYGNVRRNQPANTTWSNNQFQQSPTLQSLMPRTVPYSRSPASLSTPFRSPASYQAASQYPNTSRPSMPSPVTNMTSARFPSPMSYRAAPPSCRFSSSNNQGSSSLQRNVQVPVTSRPSNTTGVLSTNLSGPVLRVEFTNGRTIPVTLSQSLYQQVLQQIEEGIKSQIAATSSSAPSAPLTRLPVNTCATANLPARVSGSSMHSAPSHPHTNALLMSSLLVSRGITTPASSISHQSIHCESGVAPHNAVPTESVRISNTSSTHQFKVPSAPVTPKSSGSTNAAISKELYEYIYSPRVVSQCEQENEMEQTKFWICDPENYRKELEIQASLDASSAHINSPSSAASQPIPPMAMASTANSSACLSVDNTPNISPLDGHMSLIADDIDVGNISTPGTREGIPMAMASTANNSACLSVDNTANISPSDGDKSLIADDINAENILTPSTTREEIPNNSHVEGNDLTTNSEADDVVFIGEHFPGNDRNRSDTGAGSTTKNQDLLGCSSTQVLNSLSTLSCVEEQSLLSESKIELKTDSKVIDVLPHIVDVYTVQENTPKNENPSEPQPRKLNETISRLFTALKTECFPDNPSSGNESTEMSENEAVSKQCSGSVSSRKPHEKTFSLRKMDSIKGTSYPIQLEQHQNAPYLPAEDSGKYPGNQEKEKDAQSIDGTSESAVEDLMRCLDNNEPSAPHQKSKHSHSGTLETLKSPKEISKIPCDGSVCIPDSSPMQSDISSRNYVGKVTEHSNLVSETTNATFQDAAPLISLIASVNDSSSSSQNKTINTSTDTVTDKFQPMSSVPPDTREVISTCDDDRESGVNTFLLHGFEQDSSTTDLSSIKLPESPNVSATGNEDDNLSNRLPISPSSNLSDWLNSRRNSPDIFLTVSNQNSTSKIESCGLEISSDKDSFPDDMKSTNPAEDPSLGCSNGGKSVATNAKKLKIKPNLSKLCAKGKNVLKSRKMMQSIILPTHDFGYSKAEMQMPDKEENAGLENVATVLNSITDNTIRVNESGNFNRISITPRKSNSEGIRLSVSSSPIGEIVKAKMDSSPLNPGLSEHNIHENASKQHAGLSSQSANQDRNRFPEEITDVHSVKDKARDAVLESDKHGNKSACVAQRHSSSNLESSRISESQLQNSSEKCSERDTTIKRPSLAANSCQLHKSQDIPAAGSVTLEHSASSQLDLVTEDRGNDSFSSEPPSDVHNGDSLKPQLEDERNIFNAMADLHGKNIWVSPDKHSQNGTESHENSRQIQLTPQSKVRESHDDHFQIQDEMNNNPICSVTESDVLKTAPQIQSGDETYDWGSMGESAFHSAMASPETDAITCLPVSTSTRVPDLLQEPSDETLCENIEQSSVRLNVSMAKEGVTDIDNVLNSAKPVSSSCETGLPAQALKTHSLDSIDPNEVEVNSSDSIDANDVEDTLTSDLVETCAESVKASDCDEPYVPENNSETSDPSSSITRMQSLFHSLMGSPKKQPVGIFSADSQEYDETARSQSDEESISSIIHTSENTFSKQVEDVVVKQEIVDVIQTNAISQSKHGEKGGDNTFSTNHENSILFIKTEQNDELQISEHSGPQNTAIQIVDDTTKDSHVCTSKTDDTPSDYVIWDEANGIEFSDGPDEETQSSNICELSRVQAQNDEVMSEALCAELSSSSDTINSEVYGRKRVQSLPNISVSSSKKMNEEHDTTHRTSKTPDIYSEGTDSGNPGTIIPVLQAPKKPVLKKKPPENTSTFWPTVTIEDINLDRTSSKTQSRDPRKNHSMSQVEKNHVVKKKILENRPTSLETSKEIHAELTSSKTDSGNPRTILPVLQAPKNPVLKKIFPRKKSAWTTPDISHERTSSKSQVERLSEKASDTIASKSIDFNSLICDDDDYESDSPRVVRRVKPLPTITSSSEDEARASNSSRISQDSPVFVRKRKHRHISSSSSDDNTPVHLPRKENRSWRHTGKRDLRATSKYFKSYVRDVVSSDSDDVYYDAEDGFLEPATGMSKSANKTQKDLSKHQSQEQRKSKKRKRSQSPLKRRDKRARKRIEKPIVSHSSPVLGRYGLTKRFKTPVDRISSYLIKKYADPNRSVKKRKLFDDKSRPGMSADRATSSSSDIVYLDESEGSEEKDTRHRRKKRREGCVMQGFVTTETGRHRWFTRDRFILKPCFVKVIDCAPILAQAERAEELSENDP